MAYKRFLFFSIILTFCNFLLDVVRPYLEMRFDKKTRRLVTASYVIRTYLTLPLYMFVPSLGFSQVTGFNVHLINVAVCSICIFYTMLGGIKAVVWTDVVQAGVMLASLILLGVLAMDKIGGLSKVITRAVDGNRIHNFNWKLDLATRTTFWNCLLGGFAEWFSHSGVNQSCVQRIVSLPSLRHARISIIIFVFGFLFIMGINCFNGIIMYAWYYLCDPVAAGIVQKPDKLLPFFVQDVMGHLKGMPGIFISCIFSAALSTMSSNLNSLAGLVYFDYIKPFVVHTESRANYIIKIIVVINGIYCILAGIIVEQFSSILQLGYCISGLSQGAVTGIFLLGLLYPKAHSKAAFFAVILSMVIMANIVIASQIMERSGIWIWNSLPSNTDDCEKFNITLSLNSMPSLMIEEAHQFLSYFRVSFYWFMFLGALIVWIFGVLASHIMTNNQKKIITPNLVASVVHRFLPEKNVLNEEIPLKK